MKFVILNEESLEEMETAFRDAKFEPTEAGATKAAQTLADQRGEVWYVAKVVGTHRPKLKAKKK